MKTNTCNDNTVQTIYLDNPATTPCDPRVVEKMLPFFTQFFGNPHSRNHALGWTAEDAVMQARCQVATILGAEEREIIFTSGATEANTLALRGMMMRCRRAHLSQAPHLITTQTEHKSVLTCCRQLESEGAIVTYLPVGADGRISLQDLEDAISPTTRLVSVAAVNNETGVIQPLEDIGALCKERGLLFHTDATQALGKMPLDLSRWNVALASFSAHKVYGPKGIGALFLRNHLPVRLYPLVPGGGQQRGLRGGTLPVPLCVGFGEACRLLSDVEEHTAELKRIAQLSQKLVAGLIERIPLAHVNGSLEHKVPHIVNMSFPYIEGESLAMSLANICVSTGSACSSEKLEPSYVLKAMGADELSVQSSLRFGLGRFTTEEEIQITLQATQEAVQKLRDLSPLWEMRLKGVDIKEIQWRE